MVSEKTPQEINFLHKKRSKKDKIWINHKKGTIEFLPEYFDQFCYFCDYFGSIIHLHHIKYKKDGGKDLKKNLIPLCPNCHATVHKKGNGLVFSAGYYYLVNPEDKNIKFPSIRQRGLLRKYSTGSKIKIVNMPKFFNAFGKLAN